MFYIRQLKNDDCGFATLKTMLANIFRNEKYLYLPQDENHGAYSFKDLIDIAESNGVTLSGVEVNDEELINLSVNPFIASTDRDGFNHALYVYKVKKKYVYVFDPASGLKKLKKEAFLEIWDGKALIQEGVTKVDEEEYESDLSFKNKMLMYLIEFFKMVALILGFYFIHKDSYIFLPVICFSIYFIMEVLSRTYLSHLMKKIDNKYLTNMEKIPMDRKEFLVRLEEYKKTLFISPLKLFSSLLTMLLIIFISVYNSSYNLINVVLTVCFIAVNGLLVYPYFKKKEEEIALAESKVMYIESTEEYRDAINELHKASYDFVFRKTVVTIIMSFFILLSVIFTMMRSGLVSVPYIIVYFFFMMTLYREGNQVVSFDDESEKQKIAKAKFINVL